MEGPGNHRESRNVLKGLGLGGGMRALRGGEVGGGILNETACMVSWVCFHTSLKA